MTTRWHLGIIAGLGLFLAGPAAAQSRAAMPGGNLGELFGDEHYPVEALRNSEQGTVVSRLKIDEAGKVVSCVVASSSGSAALDQATCRIALERVRYRPARDSDGHAVASEVTFRVRWTLPENTPDVATTPASTS